MSTSVYALWCTNVIFYLEEKHIEERLAKTKFYDKKNLKHELPGLNKQKPGYYLDY